MYVYLVCYDFQQEKCRVTNEIKIFLGFYIFVLQEFYYFYFSGFPILSQVFRKGLEPGDKLQMGFNNIMRTSVLDPYHFDADPDPGIRFRDDGSGSGSGSGSNNFFLINFFCIRFKTHNVVFLLVILSLLFAYIKQNQ